MQVIGRVESLWRYPVKSMRGEELQQAYVGFAGVYGDRVYAFRRSAGRAVPDGDLDRYAIEQMPIVGAIEGKVCTLVERLAWPHSWALPWFCEVAPLEG